jgi:hypothetical protein
MKKLMVVGILCASAATTAFAGGLLTNTNQSVHFLRDPARDASTEIDAAYTNPAGTTQLSDGFHLSLTNQSVFQTRTITSTFAPFAGYGGSATKDFKGTASAPIVPSFQFVYKKDKYAISGGFAITGGGGKATFNQGLGSFEAPISMIPLGLSAKGIPTTQYSVDGYMEGKSFIYGAQLNGSYKINDRLSAALGIRLNIINNGYVGHLRNIMINPTHPSINPTGALMSANTFFTAAAAGAQSASNSLGAIIGGGLGGKTISELATMNVITATQKAQLLGGLGGQDLTATNAQAAYNQLVTVNTANAANTKDKELDCTQSGWGVTPVIGLNYNYDGLNIGVKYEFNTSLNIENKTTIDDTGKFADGVNTPSDIPALLTIGVEYKVNPGLKVSGGFHHFFDSNAKMANDKQQYINGGISEYLLGAEYDINQTLLVSAGGQVTRSGVTDNYQTDMSYSLNSYSIGLGGAVKLTPNLRLNIAYFFTNYDKWTKNTTNYNETTLAGTDVFNRTNKVFGIGVDWKF